MLHDSTVMQKANLCMKHPTTGRDHGKGKKMTVVLILARLRYVVNLTQEANHLLTTVDELSAKQLGDALTFYGVKSPDTKNDISAPFPFNLMFKTSIGPKGDQVGYLRPETAQGLFVNFR